MISSREELKRVVRDAVRRTPAVDLYTRLDLHALFSEARQGIDALLADPTLIAEARRYGDVRLDSGNIRERAEAVFASLFIDRSPVSRQAQVVLWSLKKVGLDAGSRDLNRIRFQWAQRQADERVLDVLDMANLSSVAVRVDLLEESAQPLSRFDDRLSASLCLDVLKNPDEAWLRLAPLGCRSHEDIRQYIMDTADRLEACSLLVTHPFDGAMWEQCVRRGADALGIPLVVASDVPTDLPEAKALMARFGREGQSFRPYYSGATVIEQLPGLWEMARKTIAAALVDTYAPLLKSGWRLSAGEVIHDIEQLMGQGRSAKRGIESSQIE